MSTERTLQHQTADMRPAGAPLDGGADWREHLPTLEGERVVLREMRASDAASLFALLTTPEVVRFISTPPTTAKAFEQFIAKARTQQTLGKFACFALTLKGHDTAIGILQVREIDPGFATGEWGFAIGSPFWGTGIFQEAAELLLDFAFTTIGAHRLEARAASRNGRGNRALQKMGAVQEGLLRRAFLCNAEYVDQVLYGLVEDDWRAGRPVRTRRALALVH